MNNHPKKYSSGILDDLVNSITPLAQKQTDNRMMIASRISELLTEKNISKSSFAGSLGRNPSEISKWLSGTQNFTIDTLTEIADKLELPLAALMEQKRAPQIEKYQILIASSDFNTETIVSPDKETPAKNNSKSYYHVRTGEC